MAFQAAVGTWFAAHLLAQMPVGTRFGLASTAYPVSLRFETGSGLDDIEIGLSNGSRIFVQCKTIPSLSKATDSDLAATISQADSLISPLSLSDVEQVAAVMAVSQTAPASLNALHQACRMFAVGGSWLEVHGRLNQQQQSALDLFRTHLASARTASGAAAPTDDEVARTACAFRIERFTVELGSTDWREASNILGSRLYSSEEAGAAPLGTLSTIVRGLIGTGAPSTREGLLFQLRAAGHDDTRSPLFDRDVLALRTKTESELRRLARHVKLPIAGGIAIERECRGELRAAAELGSFLVVGEPGAGKTGELIALAHNRFQAGIPTVLLSVDDLAGVRSEDELCRSLGLEHGFVETLAAWPGSVRGVFVLDALDAVRGGSGEGVFANLIEDVQAKLSERWSVVASIRTFDLRNGRRFQNAMRGNPPAPAFTDTTVSGVRHFHVPVLSLTELADVGRRIAPLGELLANLPDRMRQLLRNMFNLSLATELLEGGATATSFNSIATQSELIESYEDQRLPRSQQHASVSNSIAQMIQRRRLVLRRVDVAHPALDEVLSSGVMVASGDRVSFAHHVLFDHSAGRFFLDWNDPSRLASQLAGANGVGLLLGPALRFTVERVWRNDTAGRPTSWRLAVTLWGSADLDPIVKNIALRSAVESVTDPHDIEALCAMLAAPEKSAQVQMGKLLSNIVRFEGVKVGAIPILPIEQATAWATVARAAAATGFLEYADGIRFLLMILGEKGDFANVPFSAAFGSAARDLLATAWSSGREMAVVSDIAIRSVARSFVSDPAASRQLLQQILEEPRFSEHAHHELPRLAEGVQYIAPHDWNLVIAVFAVQFGRPAPSQGESWLGGHVSQIMGLKSNKRQDYEHGRWHLERIAPALLAASPPHATRAISDAVSGASAHRNGRYGQRREHRIETSAGHISIAEDGFSYTAWRRTETTAPPHGELALLKALVDFLEACSPADFRRVVEALRGEPSSASAWARVLGVAAERPGIADDLLWSVASNAAVARISDMSRDATTYLSASYSLHSIEDRRAFESLLVQQQTLPDEEGQRARYRAQRLLSVLSADAIVTSELIALRGEMVDRDELGGNDPLMRIETSWGAAEDITKSLLSSQGVDVSQGADQQALTVQRGLTEALKRKIEEETTETIADIWSQVTIGVSLLDNLSPPPHEATLHAVWGIISNAIGQISRADAYDCSNALHPSLVAITAILDRMKASEYPRPHSVSDSGSWGNWDVRVYVASSFMHLARRWGRENPELLDRISEILDDPALTVRHQVATALNTLWNVDRTRMWALMRRVADEEESPSVLAFFVGGPLRRVSSAVGDQAEEILGRIVNRFPPSANDDEREDRALDEAIGGVAADLYVGYGRHQALAHINEWIADLAMNSARLWAVVSSLRSALFMGYEADAGARHIAIQERARAVLLEVLRAGSRLMSDALLVLSNGSSEPSALTVGEARYVAAARLVEHGCNQLYFGAGAFRDGGGLESAGLPSLANKRDFLTEYQLLLDEIAHTGMPAAVHHLVELYDFLSEAAPELVFDKVAAMLIGPAALQGYQYESLALGTITNIIRRYLADHRAIFDPPERRASLISILELFSG